MKVVLATNNLAKLRELTALLKNLPIELVPQAAFNVARIEECAVTFVENALIKARHAALLTGLPAIADDSGLAIAALKGRPGIYSARYAGKNATDVENIDKVLTELRDVPEQERKATFHCVLVFMSHAQDPAPIICAGSWEGTILRAPCGRGGFGYDPIFYLPSEQKTAALLPLDVKNKISHRGKALQLLIKALAEK